MKNISLLVVSCLTLLMVSGPTQSTNKRYQSTENLPVISMRIPEAELISKPDEKPQRVEGDIYIKVVARNTSDRGLTIKLIDPYYQNRPRLLKDGRLIPYKNKIDELVRSKDDDLEVVSLPRSIMVEPYAAIEIGELDMKDWYGHLQPGSYVLVNRFRLDLGGQWTADSLPLTFQVVKK